MRLLVAGLKDGRSAVLDVTTISHPDGMMSAIPALEVGLDPLPTTEDGRGQLKDFGLPSSGVRWMRNRFPAGEVRPVHYTRTYDFHTVVDGWIDLELDDGSHRLEAGDSALVMGVDHGWRVGEVPCTMSTILIGL